MPNCYYYDEQRNRCNCYVNENLNELLEENAKLRELVRNLLRVIPRDVSGVVVGAHGEHPTYYSFADAMRELGVEVP